MELLNLIEGNNWKIRKLFIFIVVVQLILVGSIVLESMNLKIPIVREVSSFVYLLFIPGILILRIFRLHDLGNIETLLYSVGLSIASLMFTGFFVNLICPLFGILMPLTPFYLIVAMSIVILILSSLAYIRDRDFYNPGYIDICSVLSYKTLFLLLIPFLAILGTYFVNTYQNNILLVLMIVLISLIVILVGFNKFIPKELYPLAIFVIAISLLFHNSLVSPYIWGWDIHKEYYFANMVIQNSLWNFKIAQNVNAMLSITMLAPIFYKISGLDLNWIFKIVYPLIFSLVSLGLFKTYQKQSNDKIAFLSTFFFVSLFTFFIEMLSLAREEIAEFFLVLLILVIISDLNKLKKSFLSIIFVMSIVVSHYGVSYLLMIFLVLTALFISITNKNFIKNITKKFSGSIVNPDYYNERLMNYTFVVFFLVFTVSWYMYISSAEPLNSILSIGNQIGSTLFKEFLNPDAVQGMSILIRDTNSPLRTASKFLQLFCQFLIIVGTFTLLRRDYKFNFRREYTFFIYIGILLLVMGVTVPYFASAFNTSRLYQFSLIFLAPMCVIGGVSLFKILIKLFRIPRNKNRDDYPLKALSLIFVVILLFNTGFIYEAAHDHPLSISLSQKSVQNSVYDKAVLYTTLNVFEQDVRGAQWLNQHTNNTSAIIYADQIEHPLLTSFGKTSSSYQMDLLENLEYFRPDSYIFLGYPNVVKGVFRDQYGEVYSKNQVIPSLTGNSVIYSNGGTIIQIRLVN